MIGRFEMTNKLGTIRIGIAGLGTVGCGLLQAIEKQAELRLPGKISVNGVTSRTKDRERPVDISTYKWVDDPVSLARDPDIDVFVELIGGSEGVAKDSVVAAMTSGKPVVTANKALMAMYGSELSRVAEENGVDLLFEAAVAGGVPVVRALRDSLSGVRVSRVSGILNGTCNYLTTQMLDTERDYDVVLAEAQALGYAESDPELDVSGMDAAHKIAILSSIAFSAPIDFSKVDVSGVDALTLVDLQCAHRLGLTIKLIAEGLKTPNGVICRVEPKAMPHDHPLARVNGSLNTVRVEGDALGAVSFTGPGAGAGPTASAVMGDISKLFRPGVRSPFGRAAHHSEHSFVAQSGDEASPWFLRCFLADQSGALAGLSDAFARADVSIDRMLQDSAGRDNLAAIAVLTHACSRDDVLRLVANLHALETIHGTPRFVRIENREF